MKNKLCRKCNSKIPNRTKIDGVEKNLQNRKFCLICSPFKKHNTKANIDSVFSKTQKKYKEWPEEWKRKYTKRILERGKERKQLFITKLGGGCKYCSYNRCLRALSFHHVNPKEKLFGLSMNNLWSKTINVLEKEVSKCELVCVRCHFEIESGLIPNKDQ